MPETGVFLVLTLAVVSSDVFVCLFRVACSSSKHLRLLVISVNARVDAADASFAAFLAAAYATS